MILTKYFERECITIDEIIIPLWSRWCMLHVIFTPSSGPSTWENFLLSGLVIVRREQLRIAGVYNGRLISFVFGYSIR